MYNVKTANKPLTYKEAIDFLWYSSGINEKAAQAFITKID